jgi:hypothetical protein
LPKQAGFSSAATWERHYMSRASDPANGAIIFWCPLESKKEPRSDGNPYGLDTRSELGEWRGRLAERKRLTPFLDSNLKLPAPYSVFVGIERGFPGEKTLRQNFLDCLEMIPVDDMEKLVKQVVSAGISFNV